MPEPRPKRRHRRPRQRCWRPLLGLTLMVAGLIAGSGRSFAELVVFTDGRFTKVVSYAVEGDRLRLGMPFGGEMVVSMLRVDRILEDEIVAQPEPLPEPEPQVFSLRFAEHQPVPTGPHAELIYAAARRHQLNPALVVAVIRAESANDSTAVSPKGAQGLMQLMPATALRFGLAGDAVFEPQGNIDAGTRYLRWLTDHFEGRLPWVLAGYNAGEGTVARYGGVPPYRETREYIRRIYRFLGLDLDAEAL